MIEETKEFELFTRGCGFTDDSVMTVAIAEALLAVGPDAGKSEIKEAAAANMQDWGRRYSHAGYGGKFRQWLKERNPKPYGSYGNGSAMRLSAAVMSQEQLAEILCTKKATISAYENDHIDITSSIVLEIAKALNCSGSYLLEGKKAEALDARIMDALLELKNDQMREE